MRNVKFGVVAAIIVPLAAMGCATTTNRAGSGGAAHEVTAEDYALAEQWLRPNIAKLVKNVVVMPQWIGETDRFWYKRDTEDGHEFTEVDAATGRKTPAFDHKRMAAALTSLGVEDVNADSLPFSEFEYSDDLTAITFSVEETEYRCELASMTCETIEPNKADPEKMLASPDDRWAIQTKGNNLWLHNLENGEQKALTEDGEENFGYGIYYGNWKAAHIPRKRAGTDKEHPPMASEWAPDSRHVLVTHLDQRHVEPYPFIETAPEDGSFRPVLHLPRIPLTGEEPAKVDWFIVDIETGAKVRLDLPYDKLFHVHQDMLAIRRVWWNDDCTHMYAVAWGDLLDGAYLFDIDTATGGVRTVIEEHMTPRTDTNSTSYNPPNVRVVNNGAEIIWFSQRSGWGHLYLYDGKSGDLKNAITEGEWLVRDIIEVDEDRRRIFFTASSSQEGNPYFRYVYRINFDGSELTLLSPEEADHMITAPGNDILAIDGGIGSRVVSPSGNYVVYNYSRVDEPTKSAIRRVEDGSLVAVFEEADASALYAAGWQNPEEFIVKAADGQTDLYGLMYKPYNFDPKKEYPIVDSQYASPLTAVVPRNFQMAIMGVPALVRPASLASLGFVSVVIDARGTTFRSREFSHYSNGNLNTIGLEDHVAAINQLAARHSWMDIDRVGIHGGSYGGFTAFRAMFEFPEFFKAGVSVAGVGSLHNMYPDYHWEAYHGKVVYEDGSHLRPNPTAKPVNYLNNDGTIQAENLQGKLLIMLGEVDENVFPATTLQVVDRLIELDKDFDMVYFPNKPHAFRSAHSIRRVWDYLVRHLRGAEPPEGYRIAWEEPKS